MTRPGVLSVDGFQPVGTDGEWGGELDAQSGTTLELERLLALHGSSALARRRAVVGVGSNRNAAVLVEKFRAAGISPTLALRPVVLTGIAVGHSAHVSSRGYLAAAPVAEPGARTAVTVAWLDRAQTQVLDATEPNYERIALGGTEPDRSGWFLYRSRWGVLADRNGPLPLRTQPAVQAFLRTVPGLEALWSAAASPAEVTEQLARPELRQRVGEALRAAGAVRASGLGEVRL